MLYPHQVEGAKWLAARERACLFDEQGVGKTATAIEGMRKVAARRTLVLCPPVVLWNWKKEVERWAPGRKVQVIASSRENIDPGAAVVIVSHHQLIRTTYSRIVSELWDLCIVDEAHNFRNWTAKRTQALYTLNSEQASSVTARCARVWLLTGTPMVNHCGELWTMLRGLWPEKISNRHGYPASYDLFLRRMCVLKPTDYGPKPIANKKPEILRMITRDIVLRRKLDKTLDMPDVRYDVTMLAPRGMEHEDGVTIIDGEPRFDQAFSTWRRECGMAKIEPAVELLAEELNGGLDKVVVFAHHIDVVEEIAAGLRQFGVVTITGKTPADKRQLHVERFQKDPTCRVACCNIVAAGTGITLTAACNVVFVEMSFVPGENMQAAYRVNRIGQTRPVLVRSLAFAGGVDEVLTKALQTKVRMIKEVIE